MSVPVTGMCQRSWLPGLSEPRAKASLACARPCPGTVEIVTLPCSSVTVFTAAVTPSRLSSASVISSLRMPGRLRAGMPGDGEARVDARIVQQRRRP